MDEAVRKTDYQRKIDKIVGKIVAEYKPDKVILFGSAAKGQISEDTDVDLLVIKNDKRRFIDRIGEVSGMFKHTLPVDVLVYTPKEVKQLIAWGDPFIQSALSEGNVLYG